MHVFESRAGNVGVDYKVFFSEDALDAGFTEQSLSETAGRDIFTGATKQSFKNTPVFVGYIIPENSIIFEGKV